MTPQHNCRCSSRPRRYQSRCARFQHDDPGAGPVLLSLEIGTINGSTISPDDPITLITLIFDKDIIASNYATGWTIKENGVATPITTAERQADHSVVHFLIPIPWHGSDDVITALYSGGDYASESDATTLANVTAQTVTNNITWHSELNQQAEGLSNGALSAWADASEAGHDFTQSGSARPTVSDVDGYKAVVFDGVDDYMVGGNWLDDTDSFFYIVIANLDDNSNSGIDLNKGFDQAGTNSNFWITSLISQLIVSQDGTHSQNISTVSYISGGWKIYSHLFAKPATVDLKIDGAVVSTSHTNNDSITTYSNSKNIKMAISEWDDVPTGADYTKVMYRARLVCVPAPSAADQAALVTRLGARYGVTV